MSLRKILKFLVPEYWRPPAYLKRQTLRRSQRKIMAGPFRGMKYVDRAIGSLLIPKLLGSYEEELIPVIMDILNDPPARLIDVGAAEGYYAVGLAFRCPNARIVAFESEGAGRALLREAAMLNEVAERIDIRGHCGPAELESVLERDRERTLLICDCEGGEEELLDPARLTALRNISILVELHEFVSRGIGDRLRRRFESSHAIEEIRTDDQRRREFPFSTPYMRLMPRADIDWALGENRPEPMSWLWMKPRLDAGA